MNGTRLRRSGATLRALRTALLPSFAPPAALVALALALAAGLPLSGCHDGPSRNRLRADLEIARVRWEEAAMSSYAVTQRRVCFCPLPAEWTVVVVDGTPSFIESYEDPGSGLGGYTMERIALSEAMSVEELFDWIEDAIETADHIDVEYDPALGFPSTIVVDFVEMAVDDEISWHLRDVRRAGVCTEIGCVDALRVTLRAPAGGFAPGEYVVRIDSPDFPAAGTDSCGFSLPAPCLDTSCPLGPPCDAVLFPPDEVQITVPFRDGDVRIVVEIDRGLAATAVLAPDPVRSQPNGPLCPPVCWSADVGLALP